MPAFCVSKVIRALNSRRQSLNGSRVLVLGVAYKKNVNDTRESPALRIIDLLAAEGGIVSYHDAYVAALATRGLASVPLTPATVAAHDVVVVVTDHDGVDWDMVAERAPLVVDLRHVVPDAPNVWRL